MSRKSFPRSLARRATSAWQRSMAEIPLVVGTDNPTGQTQRKSLAAKFVEDNFDVEDEPRSIFGSIYKVPGPRSQELITRANACVGNSANVALYGIALDHSTGPATYTDVDGNEYLDFLSAASCNVLGYRAGLEKVYAAQCRRLHQTCYGYLPTEPPVELAERLIALSPLQLEYERSVTAMEAAFAAASSPAAVASHPPVPAPPAPEQRVLYGLSGSDGCSTAIQAARKATGRMGVMSFKHSYHGSVGTAQCASGFGLEQSLFPVSALAAFAKVPFPDHDEQEVEQVLQMIDSEFSKGETACIIVEVIQGDSGAKVPFAGFLPRLQQLCSQHDVVFIVDEVQTGMGRTGTLFACEYEGLAPDIVVLGKGVAGGYAPMSATIGREDILNALDPAQKVFSFTAYPPACAVASATLDRLLAYDGALMRHAETQGERIRETLKPWATGAYADFIECVRGRGFVMGLAFKQDSNPFLCRSFAFRLLQKGVLCGYLGASRDTLRIQPPLSITETQIDAFFEVMHDTAHEIFDNPHLLPEGFEDDVHRFCGGGIRE